MRCAQLTDLPRLHKTSRVSWGSVGVMGQPQAIPLGQGSSLAATGRCHRILRSKSAGVGSLCFESHTLSPIALYSRLLPFSLISLLSLNLSLSCMYTLKHIQAHPSPLAPRPHCFGNHQPTNLIKTHFSNCWSNSPNTIPCCHHAGPAQFATCIQLP